MQRTAESPPEQGVPKGSRTPRGRAGPSAIVIAPAPTGLRLPYADDAQERNGSCRDRERQRSRGPAAAGPGADAALPGARSRRRRSTRGTAAKVFGWILLALVVVVAASPAASYLYGHETLNAIAPHTAAVKATEKHPQGASDCVPARDGARSSATTRVPAAKASASPTRARTRSCSSAPIRRRTRCRCSRSRATFRCRSTATRRRRSARTGSTRPGRPAGEPA